jgi:enamine deaminase RidA (YjgF/YER057c/UK114 family)
VSSLKYLEVTPLGSSGIDLALGVRAGSWLFFTGHEASDYRSGLAPAVVGKPGLPLGGAARPRREGDYILERLRRLIEAEGGDMRHIIRVDQYYPSAEFVNPYQRARKALLKDFVPPSTSVLMEELLVEGAGMDISWMAVLPGGGREPQPARPEGVPVPPHSGFNAAMTCGDYVFVAGQMPNNEAMTGIEAAAYRPPNAIWNGTDIRLQAEFLIGSRLKAGLEAGGSSLKNAVKAQVYLTNINDLPEFMDVWNNHFHSNPCALTVVATKGLALRESIIEINIFGVKDDGAIKKEVIAHAASDAMRLGPAAVRAGDLLCLSALYAADESGAMPAVSASRGLRYLGVPARTQMDAILSVAGDICRAGGTSLDQVVRATHFVTDLNVVPSALASWKSNLPHTPLPFGAVRTLPTIPHCDITLDMWAWRPDL